MMQDATNMQVHNNSEYSTNFQETYKQNCNPLYPVKIFIDSNFSYQFQIYMHVVEFINLNKKMKSV